MVQVSGALVLCFVKERNVGNGTVRAGKGFARANEEPAG